MSSYRCGDFHLDVANRRFTRDGAEIALEPKLFAVIRLLVAKPGALITRNELLDSVWGHRYVTPSTLNRLITLARRAFGDDADEPRYIQTVHGAGYRYIGPAEAARAETAEALRFGPPLVAQLPARVDALIGREDELGALSGLFQHSRAVTVLGTGGMGKTRCALECARRMAADYPDGVWFFDLAPMQHGADGLRALAAALGIPSADPSGLLHKILPLLARRRALLLLDNCDRIATEVGAFVFDLLRGTELLHVLATSQVPLNFIGEQLMRMPPLALPDSNAGGQQLPADIERAPAVAMLLTRIRSVQPRFALSASSTSAVIEICRRLDGMPLALELAAARFALLSAEQVLQRLEHRFRFLGSETAGRDPRHRNLLGLLDWSFALLSEEERRLLCWLSVFVQGWSMEATLNLASAMGREEESIVEVLGGLVDKSLVSIVPGVDPPRYYLLESVREYALEQLRSDGEEVSARDAHLKCIVSLAQATHRDILGGRMQERVGQLVYERGNIGSAVEYAAANEQHRALALSIVGSLTLYIRARGPLDWSLRWCRVALAGSEALAAPERGRALLCLAVSAVHMRNVHEPPEPLLKEAIRLARQHGDLWTEACACGYYAMWEANEGRLAAAADNLAVTRRLAEAIDDDVLRGLAGLAEGWIHMAEGDGAAAVATLRSVRDLGEDHHQRHFIRVYLALALIGLKEWDAAGRELAEAMGVAIQHGNVRGAAGCVEAYGYLAAFSGLSRDAARLLGAAHAVRERTEIPLFNFWLPLNQAAHAAARSALGAREYESCLQAGAAMREEDAANEAYAGLRAFAATREAGG